MGRIYCLYSGSDGQSHFADVALCLDNDPTGRLTTGVLGARAWMYGESVRERFVDWHTAGSGGVSVILEGRMDVEVGSGERRSLEAGDMLIALDTAGQGHRTRVPERTRGLAVALDGDPAEIMQKLFGRVLGDASNREPTS